jgi:hypothetical protein
MTFSDIFFFINVTNVSNNRCQSTKIVGAMERLSLQDYEDYQA